MGETTKVFLAYGLSGALNVIQFAVIWFLARELKEAYIRNEMKSDKNTDLNKATAQDANRMLGEVIKWVQSISRSESRRRHDTQSKNLPDGVIR